MQHRSLLLTGLLCGVGAFIVGTVGTLLASLPWSPGRFFTNHGSLRELGFRYYVAHRVNVVVHEQDATGWLITDWFSFAYLEPVRFMPYETMTNIESPLGYATASAYTFSPNSHAFVSDFLFGDPVFAIPPLVLVGAGAAATRRISPASPRQAGVAGASIVLGYFPVTFLGVHLVGGVLIDDRILGGTYLFFPDPIVAIVRMGIVYPVVFGVIGGVLAYGYRPWHQRDRKEQPVDSR